MKKTITLAMAILAMMAKPVPRLDAQVLASPEPGREIGSVSLKLGMLAPQTTFTDESFGESSFSNGLAVGLSATSWPMFGRRVGVRAQLVRSQTDGQNSTSEFAPIAVNDPTVYLYTLELAVRHPVTIGAVTGLPFFSAGYGGKHYTWAVSQHKSTRFGAATAAAGLELRPSALGAFGIIAEARAYRSSFRAFGIDDGTWDPGFYGGEVGGVNNLDVLFASGVSLNF